MQRSHKIAFLLLCSLFLLACGCGKSSGDGAAKEEGAAKPAAASKYLVQVSQVQSGSAQEFRTILGRLVEINRTTVSSEVSGKLVQMTVEEGTPVVVNETVIAVVDDTWNKIAIRETTARINALKAKKKYQESEVERSEALVADKAVSQSEFEATQAELDQLQAEIEAEEALLGEYQVKVERSVILAPFTGQVVQRYVDIGSYVTPGTAIAEVISSGMIDARIYIPETFIQRMEIGQEIEIGVDPLGKAFTGKVVQIVGSAATASRTYPVRVRLDDQDGVLKAGMSVTSRIPVTDEFDSLLVPTDAVIVKPDGNTIWVIEQEVGADGKPTRLVAQPVPVRIQADMLRTLAVKAIVKKNGEGKRAALLKPGAQVVVEGAERLSPGMEVTIVESPYQLEALPGLYESGQQKVDE